MGQQISDWNYAKGISRKDADEYLRAAISHYVRPVLDNYKLENSYCAVTGLSIAKFELISNSGRISIEKATTSAKEIEKWIRQCPTVPTEIQMVAKTLFLPIVGLGELFGFVGVFEAPPDLNWRNLKQDWVQATNQIADFNYARRVIALAVPIAYPSELASDFIEIEFLQQVARTTSLSFGADAAIIRLYDPNVCAAVE